MPPDTGTTLDRFRSGVRRAIGGRSFRRFLYTQNNARMYPFCLRSVKVFCKFNGSFFVHCVK